MSKSTTIPAVQRPQAAEEIFVAQTAPTRAPLGLGR